MRVTLEEQRTGEEGSSDPVSGARRG